VTLYQSHHSLQELIWLNRFGHMLLIAAADGTLLIDFSGIGC
jgi:hypothetical protein